jgi:hypothetical protein
LHYCTVFRGLSKILRIFVCPVEPGFWSQCAPCGALLWSAKPCSIRRFFLLGQEPEEIFVREGVEPFSLGVRGTSLRHSLCVRSARHPQGDCKACANLMGTPADASVQASFLTASVAHRFAVSSCWCASPGAHHRTHS